MKTHAIALACVSERAVSYVDECIDLECERKTKGGQDVFQLCYSYSRLPSLQDGKVKMTTIETVNFFHMIFPVLTKD